MAKTNKARQKTKVQYPEEVNSLAQRIHDLPENDKGELLRKLNVTYVQSQWRPVSVAPELRLIVNRVSRVAVLFELMMRLASSRKLPVEDLAVISESKVRKNTIEPIVEQLNTQIHEMEEVLNKNKNKGENYRKSNETGKFASKPAPAALEAEGEKREKTAAQA